MPHTSITVTVELRDSEAEDFAQVLKRAILDDYCAKCAPRRKNNGYAGTAKATR